MYPRFAAIDIGSNAIRLQISRIIPSDQEPFIKKLEYVRFPLRLGDDVFDTGKISPTNEQRFIKLMGVFKSLIELFEVDEYAACATSAMRNAINGQELAQKTLEHTGLKIHIIDGEAEAGIINHAIFQYIEKGAFMHVDVGGGSTELNVYQNREKVATKSFPVGSVRILKNKPGTFDHLFKEMKAWIESQNEAKDGQLKMIGTGGNIIKLYDLAEEKKKLSVSYDELERVREKLIAYSYEERLSILKLNQDRADVILPASGIYLRAMRWAKTKAIIVPDLGLKDGLISYLYLKSIGKSPFSLGK